MSKYLYCPKCKKYPDSIEEIYTHFVEHREWDGECYASVNTEQDYDSTFHCRECGEECEEGEE